MAVVSMKQLLEKRRSFRTPNQKMEPQNETVYLRGT